MESTEPGQRIDTPNGLRGSVKKSILVKHTVRTRCATVGGVIRSQAVKVPFSQHHDMVEALAPNRSDQSFDTTALPQRARYDGRISDAHHS